MAGPGELVRRVSSLLGIPEPTVLQHDRNLLMAGLRSKGGRGTSAARVTPRDAAHLLIAILGSGLVKDSVETVRRYGETRRHKGTSGDYAKTGISRLQHLSPDHSFNDAVEALIAASADGSLHEAMRSAAEQNGFLPFIEITIQTPIQLGDISIRGGSAGMSSHGRYALPNPWDQHNSIHPPPEEVAVWKEKVEAYHADIDLTQYRQITAKTVLSLGELLGAQADKS